MIHTSQITAKPTTSAPHGVYGRPEYRSTYLPPQDLLFVNTPVATSAMTLAEGSYPVDPLVRTDVTSSDAIWRHVSSVPGDYYYSNNGLRHAVTSPEDLHCVSDTESEHSCSSADTMILTSDAPDVSPEQRGYNSDRQVSSNLYQRNPKAENTFNSYSSQSMVPRPNHAIPGHSYRISDVATGVTYNGCTSGSSYMSGSSAPVSSRGFTNTFAQGNNGQQNFAPLRDPRISYLQHHEYSSASLPHSSANKVVDNHSDDGYESNDTNLSVETDSTSSSSSRDSAASGLKSILKQPGSQAASKHRVRFGPAEVNEYTLQRQKKSPTATEHDPTPVRAVKKVTAHKTDKEQEKVNSLTDRLLKLVTADDHVHHSPIEGAAVDQTHVGYDSDRLTSTEDESVKGKRTDGLNQGCMFTTVQAQNGPGNKYSGVEQNGDIMKKHAMTPGNHDINNYARQTLHSGFRTPDVQNKIPPGDKQLGVVYGKEGLDRDSINTADYISSQQVQFLLKQQSVVRRKVSRDPDSKPPHHSSLTQLPIVTAGSHDQLPRYNSLTQLPTGGGSRDQILGNRVSPERYFKMDTSGPPLPTLHENQEQKPNKMNLVRLTAELLDQPLKPSDQSETESMSRGHQMCQSNREPHVNVSRDNSGVTQSDQSARTRYSLANDVYSISGETEKGLQPVPSQPRHRHSFYGTYQDLEKMYLNMSASRNKQPHSNNYLFTSDDKNSDRLSRHRNQRQLQALCTNDTERTG